MNYPAYSSFKFKIIRLSIFLMISVIIFSPISVNGEDDGDPDLTVSAVIMWRQFGATPYINPMYLIGKESFIGEVTCQFTGINIDAVEVDLHVDAGGWKCDEIPTLWFNKAVGIHSFSFTVSFPPGQRTGEYPLSLNGTWKAIPGGETGKLDEIYSSIIVDQYSRFIVNESADIRIKAGRTISTIVPIENSGNGDDLAICIIHDQDNLEDRGWTYEVPSDNIPISMNGTEHIPLKIHVPIDERPGKYQIELRIVSPRAEAMGEITGVGRSYIEIEVLNNYRDEIILVGLIASPILLLTSLFILFFVIYSERKSVKQFRVLRVSIEKGKV